MVHFTFSLRRQSVQVVRRPDGAGDDTGAIALHLSRYIRTAALASGGADSLPHTSDNPNFTLRIMSYQQGDKVEYRPIGGSEETVAHSTGVIEDVFEAEDGVSFL